MTAGRTGSAGKDVVQDVLLEAARPVPANDRTAELLRPLRAVASDPSGEALERLWELGRLHGLLPLLARRVAALPAERAAGLPGEFSDRLAGRRRFVSRRNLHQLILAGELAGRLESGGIPVVVFKGPALAADAYPEIGLREFVDLDLLVGEGDRDRGLRVLRAEGFQVADRSDASAPRGGYAVELYRERDGCAVDLHWGLAPAHRALVPDPAGIRRRASRVDVQNVTFRVPAPGDHQLLLAVHGAKHGPRPWPKLKWIADTAWLLERHPDADWEAALDRAGSSGAGRALLVAAFLAGELEATLPPRLAGALAADPTASVLGRQVMQRLFVPYDAREPLLRRVAFDWKLLEGPRERAGYLARRLFLPTERDREDRVGRRLPEPLLFIYRWIRLGLSYLRRPGGLTRHWE